MISNVNYSSWLGSCLSCNLTNCLWCNGTNICGECKPGTFLDGAKCTVCAAQCLLCSSASNCSKCSAAYFVNTANGCTLCDSNCLSCVDRVGCVQCSSYAPALFSIVGGVCTNCNLTACLSCSAPLVCSSCRNGTYLSAGKCINCPTGCSICMSNNCSQCSYGYFFQNGACIYGGNNCISVVDNSGCIVCFSSLAVNYYIYNGVCISCNIVSCIVCNATNICLTCAKQFYLNANKCVRCPTGCQQCLNNTFCTSCLN